MKFNYLFKDLKNTELKLFIATVFLAVLCVSSLVFLTQGIRSGLVDTTGALLGGDRVIHSPTPIEKDILEKAQTLGIRHSETISFLSMLVHHDKLALAEVKGVDEHYPLKGHLQGTTVPFGEERVLIGIPEPGTVWIEVGLLSLLDVSLNDTLVIGHAIFKITKILTQEPDRGGEGFSIAPRALIHALDVAKTGVIQPGSRQTYNLLLAGEDNLLEEFDHWVSPKLNLAQRLVRSSEARPAIQRVIDQAEEYLSVIVLLNLVIGAFAVAQAARRFSKRQYKMAAILRCLGGSFDWIVRRFLVEIFISCLIAGVSGFVSGAILLVLTRGIFEQLFLQPIHMVWFKPALFTAGIMILFAALFGLPILMKLRTVSPLAIFQQANQTPIISGLSINLKGLLTKISRSWPVAYRLGVFNIIRYPIENLIQLLAFAVVMLCAWMLFFLRSDLLDTWKLQIPKNAPNYFIINLNTNSKESFLRFLSDRQIQAQTLYPVVRARLVQTDGKTSGTKNSIIEDEEDKRGFRRLLNLTYGLSLPRDNTIVAGKWFVEADNGRSLVSIEQGFSERLNVGINSTLTFQIEDKIINAIVQSIRTVEWESFNPNFFVIFPPHVLNSFASTYMTSFYLPPHNPQVLNQLMKSFPEVSIIDVSVILKSLENIIQKLSLSIEYLWLFTLLMALILMFCTLLVSLEERYRDAALLRAIGATPRKLKGIFLSEFVTLGTAAGMIAVVGANIIYAWILADVFKLHYQLKYTNLLFGPLVGILLISGMGWLVLRRILNLPAKTALSFK